MVTSLLTDSVSYNLDRAIHYALLWGLEGLELRDVGGPHDRVPFVNESRLRGRILESELPVTAVVPGLFEGDLNDRAAALNDLALLDETLAFCTRIGCPRVVVSGFGGGQRDTPVDPEDVLGRAALKASSAGVRLCVINEFGGLVPDGRTLSALLAAVDSPSLEAAWDPAEAAVSGEDPLEGLAALGARVGLVRCRNGKAEGNGWQPRSIDSGEIDWPAQIRKLQATGFKGPVSLRVELEPKPKHGLHDATTLIHVIRAVKREGARQT